MTNQPVGMLDSGLGGISVLAQALRDCPREDYVYFGDTANIPYGDKEPEEVLRLTRLGVDKLTAHGCKAIVIACNTASVTALELLRKNYSIPFVGVVPAIKPAGLLSRNKTIGLFATNKTVSQAYTQNLIDSFASECKVRRFAMPEIVSCPGCGRTDPPI